MLPTFEPRTMYMVSAWTNHSKNARRIAGFLEKKEDLKECKSLKILARTRLIHEGLRFGQAIFLRFLDGQLSCDPSPDLRTEFFFTDETDSLIKLEKFYSEEWQFTLSNLEERQKWTCSWLQELEIWETESSAIGTKLERPDWLTMVTFGGTLTPGMWAKEKNRVWNPGQAGSAREWRLQRKLESHLHCSWSFWDWLGVIVLAQKHWDRSIHWSYSQDLGPACIQDCNSCFPPARTHQSEQDADLFNKGLLYSQLKAFHSHQIIYNIQVSGTNMDV